MKKLRYSKEQVWQVRTNFLMLKPWLSGKTLKRDKKCSECKKDYAEMLKNGVEKIALMTVRGKPNAHLCNDCGKRYINECGAIDIEGNIYRKKMEKSTNQSFGFQALYANTTGT